MKMTHTLCATLLLGALSVPAFAQTSDPEKPNQETAPIEAPMKPDIRACIGDDLDCKGGHAEDVISAPSDYSIPQEVIECTEGEDCDSAVEGTTDADTPSDTAPIVTTPDPVEGTCISGDGTEVPCPDFDADAPKTDVPE